MAAAVASDRGVAPLLAQQPSQKVPTVPPPGGDARAVVWSVLKSVVEEGIDKVGDDANLLDAGLDSLGLAALCIF